MIKHEPDGKDQPKRKCLYCRRTLWPWFSNQQVHWGCRKRWRRKYLREYQRRERGLDQASLDQVLNDEN